MSNQIILRRETMTAQRPAPSHRSAVRLTRRVTSFTALGLVLGLLPGCSSVTGSPVVAQIRLIDASSNVPAIDVYQGSGVLAYNLGLGTITSYVPLVPGNYSITSTTAHTATALASTIGTFGGGTQHTVVIGDYSTVLQETVLQDQTIPAPAGQVSLRIINQASNAGAVDVYLIPVGATISTVKPVLTAVSYNTNTGYLNEPAGTYTLAAVPTGTVPSATSATAYEGAQVVYPGGSARTIVLLNQPLLNAPGLQIVVAADFDPATATS